MARTQVQTELIATNAISGTIIADNAITAVHIATNAISGVLVQDSGITTTMIAANNVTAAKIVSDGIETRHLHSNVVSGLSAVTPVAGDYLLAGDTSDSNNLKKILVSGVTGLVSTPITALNNATANELVTVGSTTTELDGEANLTFDGSTLQVTGALTVGVDDTGHDVKFFGATTSRYMLWNQSNDSLDLRDDCPIRVGNSGDLSMFHDATNGRIRNDTGVFYVDQDQQDGNLILRSDNSSGGLAEYIVLDGGNGNTILKGGYGNTKLATSSTGVSVTGSAVGTLTTDNDGSFDMAASNNFKCTPSGNFTLTFTNIVSQSGNILLVNSGGHTVSAHANTKVDANLLATVTAAGTYLISYFSDGTNVYLTNSAIYP